jgi:hypothetical protein
VVASMKTGLRLTFAIAFPPPPVTTQFYTIISISVYRTAP